VLFWPFKIIYDHLIIRQAVAEFIEEVGQKNIIAKIIFYESA